MKIKRKMKNQRLWIKAIWMLSLLIGSLVIFSQCSKTASDDIGEPNIVLSITEISFPSSVEVNEGANITLNAKGFDEGDEIIVTSTENSNIEYTLPLKSITAQSATITLPAGFTSGNYKLTVRRGDQTAALGFLQIEVVDIMPIPDKIGMNVKGMVVSEGVGVSGVVVSDGIEVTMTDAQGIYYLNSAKKHGYVFISVPGNYEMPLEGKMAQFFKRFTSFQSHVIERMDFELMPVNNEKHIVLAMADLHLAAKQNDIAQFENGFLRDANGTIDNYESQGYKVYGLTLGDLAWDTYWYANSFALPEYVVQINRLNCPVFNTMGNHDNDPYYANDWYAENTYRNHIGPTYYSFNLGDIHYVVLDNTEYLNEGGSMGSIGRRNYNPRITDEQLAWVKKDLATVKDKNKPLVIAMHIALLEAPVIDGQGNETPGSVRVDGGAQLIAELAAFSNVIVMSGHTHVNWTKQYASNLVERNIGAVSATWWWTGYYGNNHLCRDGSPGGYAVFNSSNNEYTWYYKSIGQDRDYQFRAYDMNEVHITAAKFAPNSSDEELAPYVWNYADEHHDNEIMVNVWGYDPQWAVEIIEEGTPLAVSRTSARDPLHVISYQTQRLDLGHNPTSSFVTGTTRRMFKATASSPTSTVEIKVTDRFGKVYTETMTRPKAFHYAMR